MTDSVKEINADPHHDTDKEVKTVIKKKMFNCVAPRKIETVSNSGKTNITWLYLNESCSGEFFKFCKSVFK
jgi:hypothetical protein